MSECNTDALVRLFGDEFVFSIGDATHVNVTLRNELFLIVYVGYIQPGHIVEVHIGNTVFSGRTWKFKVNRHGDRLEHRD